MDREILTLRWIEVSRAWAFTRRVMPGEHYYSQDIIVDVGPDGLQFFRDKDKAIKLANALGLLYEINETPYSFKT